MNQWSPVVTRFSFIRRLILTTDNFGEIISISCTITQAVEMTRPLELNLGAGGVLDYLLWTIERKDD